MATPTPCRIALPVHIAGVGDKNLLLVWHDSQLHRPASGLRALRDFSPDGRGGWLAAACSADGRWGFLDAQAQWRTPPTWDDARSFGANLLARCKVGEHWGYADRSGALALDARFDDAQPFAHGLAAVRETGAKGWGFIDALGRPAFAQRFFAVGEFGACGLAPARPLDKPSRCGYIDRSGAWAIAPKLHAPMAFGEQAVVPNTADGQRWGLMDTQGRWVMPPRYPLINAFNADGLAYFAEDDPWTNGYGYLDAEGQVVVKGERGLSAEMACGLATAEFDGSRYLSRRGPLATPALAWGGRFSPLGHAVVRLADGNASHEGQRWALLQRDGQAIALPDAAIEPLTDSHGRIPTADVVTPLQPFLGRDDSVLLLDGQARLQFQACFDGLEVQLRDAAGRLCWHGPLKGEVHAPAPFFDRPPEAWLEGLDACDAVTEAADALLAETEARLHAFASDLPLSADRSEDEDDDGNEDEGNDDGDEDDDASDPLARAERDAPRTLTRRRLLRVYVGEDHNAHYPFLVTQHGESLLKARARMVERLHQRFGPTDPDPEHIPLPWHISDAMLAWAVPLQQPLAHDTSGLKESREQWLCLFDRIDAGDGDEWHEVWLLAAPSLDALAVARRQRLAPPSVDIAAGASAGTPADNTGAPLTVPPSRPAATEVEMPRTPEPTLTAANLEAQVRAGCDSACSIAPECMTAEALALCRELYGRDADWCWRDDRHSQLPTRWDHNSLGEVWGALLDEALCIRAVQAGAPLADVPVWWRTERVEQAALAADIYNIGHIAAQNITPALAERAVRHDYGRLIAHIPEALLTPALCLTSARSNGLSLACMPEAWRSAEVCAAALRDDARAYPAVPAAVREAACTLLIAQRLAQDAEDRDDANAGHGARPSPGTRWHGLRAWARLWSGDFAGAITDARLALPEVRYPQNAHYVLAQAHWALGQHDEAALAASSVLALEDPYQPEFNPEEDTRWLRAVVRAQAAASTDGSDPASHETNRLDQLQRHPLALADLPREAITDAMVDTALAADPEAIRFVPRRLMTPARYLVALEQRVKHYQNVPPAMRNAAIEDWQRANG